MCGIAGTFQVSPEEDSRIQDVVQSISHRGPDEKGYFNSQHGTLGMARLSIIDVTSGHQPNFSENRDVISIFNGEIYNYKELRSVLISKGHTFNNESDSDLIPHLYEEYGDDFVSHIQGMFSIAILVESEKKLVLARDRVGKKPLWFSRRNNGVVFCSELKGLLNFGGSRTFNREILAEYLYLGYTLHPRSPFLGIEQIQPGHIAIFGGKSEKHFRYWSPISEENSEITVEEAESRTTELLTEAVSCRLVSERPIGVFLSGGIDSSLVAAIASQMLPKIKTFTIGFESARFDEAQDARKIAEFLGTDHYELTIKPDPELILGAIAKSLDVPFADSSFLPTFLLSEFASREVVVALSGDGGDETFGGYDRYRFTKQLSRVNPILRSRLLSFLNDFPVGEGRKAKVLRALSSNSLSKAYLELQANLGLREIRALTGSSIGLAELLESLNVEASREFLISTLQRFDIEHYLPGDLLYKVDMASMANSLEVRSPFLDYRLVEFGLSLPDRLKVDLFKNKKILKNILSRLVPKEHSMRPKKGFGIPRDEWLRNDLKDLLFDSLQGRDSFVGELLDHQRIETLLSEHMKGKNHGASLWSLLMLELWAENWLN